MSKRYAIVGDLVAEQRGERMVPGGSGAIGLAVRELGGEVTLRSCLGSDDAGTEVLRQIKAARIHPGLIDRIEGETARVVRYPDGTTSDWQPGVLMTKGGVMDIYALFAHHALIVDLLDQSLRTFLIDLPAHTDGKVRMLTTLSHLDHIAPAANELEIAMRCDTIVGTEAQYMLLTGEADAASALGVIFDRMPFAHLRAAIAITDNGLDILSRDVRIVRPVQGAVPALLVPQVAAGVAWGMANHAEWDAVATASLDPTSVA